MNLGFYGSDVKLRCWDIIFYAVTKIDYRVLKESEEKVLACLYLQVTSKLLFTSESEEKVLACLYLQVTSKLLFTSHNTIAYIKYFGGCWPCHYARS